MIKLSGYIPDKDIKIIYTGLRPGEKLYEELIMDEEKDNMKKVFGDKIFVTEPIKFNADAFDINLKKLYNAAFDSPDKVVKIIKEIVPNFNQKGV